jgi:hypothetical protein
LGRRCQVSAVNRPFAGGVCAVGGLLRGRGCFVPGRGVCARAHLRRCSPCRPARPGPQAVIGRLAEPLQDQGEKAHGSRQVAAMARPLGPPRGFSTSRGALRESAAGMAGDREAGDLWGPGNRPENMVVLDLWSGLYEDAAAHLREGVQTAWPSAPAWSYAACLAGQPLATRLWVIPPRPWPHRKKGETTPAADLAGRANLWLRPENRPVSEQTGQGNVRTTYPRGNPGQDDTAGHPG